jgi:hypothetical protein
VGDHSDNPSGVTVINDFATVEATGLHGISRVQNDR